VQPSAIRELLRLGTNPDIISFGGGYPDPALFPIAELHQEYARLLVAEHAAALQYTASNGLPQLRAQVADRLTRDGIWCTADDVLIIQGGQQGLDLAAKLMVNAGDVIVTENPTFLGALIAFAPTEPRYAAVRTDADGMETGNSLAGLRFVGWSSSRRTGKPCSTRSISAQRDRGGTGGRSKSSLEVRIRARLAPA
jgi:2-aminoadipate transaminase